MERLLEAADGKRGETTLAGESLHAAPLEKLTRAAAAHGDGASALLRLVEGDAPVKRQLRGNPVDLTVDDLNTVEQMLSFVERIRRRYLRVRNEGDG